VDQFPAEMWFDITLRFSGRRGADSLSLRYEAGAETVEHVGGTVDVSRSSLFVIPLDSPSARLYHLPTDSAAVTLPRATRAALRRRFPQAFGEARARWPLAPEAPAPRL
jgi:hypothetical protein